MHYHMVGRLRYLAGESLSWVREIEHGIVNIMITEVCSVSGRAPTTLQYSKKLLKCTSIPT